MKHILLSLLMISSLSISAQTATDLFEKAYFLETAKGQEEQALEIYRQIVSADANNENGKAILQSLERMLILQKQKYNPSIQEKVDNFDLKPTIQDHIINTFGPPERYAANNKEYAADELPHTGFSMYYPEGFKIQTSFNKIHSIQFTKPIFEVRGITIGSSEEDVFKEFPPLKYADYKTRKGHGFESGTIYTNITSSSDFKNYFTTENIAFFINKEAVVTMTITNQ